MNNETRVVIDYFQAHAAFIGATRVKSKYEKIQFMKKNLALEEDTELTQVQCNLFYAAIYNVEWGIVIQELDDEGGININDWD